MRDDQLYLDLVIMDEEDRMKILTEAMNEAYVEEEDAFLDDYMNDLDIDLNDLLY